MAEREGFEPSIRFCRILTFQASAFDHSATAPHIAGKRPSKGRASRGQGCGVRPQAPMRSPCGALDDRPPRKRLKRWRDERSAVLPQRIKDAGLEGKDVQTLIDHIEYDEGRDPVAERAWEKV